MGKRICVLCKKENIQEPKKNQICIYCNKGRIQTWNKCLICNNWFHPERISQKLCGLKCKNKFQSTQGSSKKGRKYSHLQRSRIATCLICLKEFRAVKDQNGRFGGKIKLQVYCSKECWSRRNPPKEKKCRYCGKTYMTYERETKVYCLKECRDLDFRERFKGENAHNWKGGRTKKNKILRSRKAYRVWREAVFKRDNYTCRKCNKSNTYIQAHHIKHVKDFPELIYDVNNGKTLCLECHQKEHPELKLNIKRLTRGTKHEQTNEWIYMEKNRKM